MTPRREDRDDQGVRVRPNRRGSRPRSKQRPEHADAVTAMVTGVDRGRYTLLVTPQQAQAHPAVAMKARELGRERVVVGDLVDVVGDVSGDQGTLGRIVRIAERRTALRRSADDVDPVERVVVANADRLVVVTALADPEPRTRMIDRCAIAAYDAGMDVLLCLTKADLVTPEQTDALVELYRPLGVEVVVTRRSGGTVVGLAAVRAALEDRVSVLVGHSGVGKSTLVNALVPGADRAIGRVNDVTGRGRHTSTSAVALRLPPAADGRTGWVIDTPGVRSFGLAHVDAGHLLAAFTDLAAAAAELCPRGCTHTADAPDCGLDEWLAEAPEESTRAARAARVDSFRRLLASKAGGEADHAGAS